MFLFKNSIFATFSGDVLARSLLTTRPAVLNKRPLGTLVAECANLLLEVFCFKEREHMTQFLSPWFFPYNINMKS